MPSRRDRLWNSSSAAICGFLFICFICGQGCGSKTIDPSKVSETAGLPDAKNALLDLAQLLTGLAAGNLPPPKEDADFVNYDVEHPAIATLIANKSVVYNYGTTTQSSNAGTSWIAMQSNAKESGGWVLLDNGEVKDLPAAEVSTLSPAKPK
ncbi:MAG: hypothetical protein FJ308_14370 [Planctomycetes bacterium]|nr:hypothetical protein [Planctomycetota bacterium]